ncbi:MAG TPA: hypothetical protein VEU47_10320 [Candidatus Cybelea sp.]|nr:hypothetical protein [Candidatus Cybelea sp.]
MITRGERPDHLAAFRPDAFQNPMEAKAGKVFAPETYCAAKELPAGNPH